MVVVTVSARIAPTEKEPKLRIAIENLFPELQLRKEGELLVGTGTDSSLEYLKRLVWVKRVLDTVRAQLLKNLDGDTTHLFLNKQAAFARKLGVSDKGSSPLGEIKLILSGKNLEEFIDISFPMTERGRPVLRNR